MRYIGQRDTYSCGPIAVLNALKWSGMRVTSRSHMGRVNRLCNSGIAGILDRDITHALSKYRKLKFRVRRYITMRQLDAHLRRGGCAIISHEFVIDGEDAGHYIFIPSKTSEKFLVINDCFCGTVTHYDRKEMTDLLRYRGFSGSPCAWLISRRSK